MDAILNPADPINALPWQVAVLVLATIIGALAYIVIVQQGEITRERRTRAIIDRVTDNPPSGGRGQCLTPHACDVNPPWQARLDDLRAVQWESLGRIDNGKVTAWHGLTLSTRYRVYTGPTLVPVIAARLTDAGLHVTCEGTEHVHVECADGETALLSLLGSGFSYRDVARLPI